MRRKALAKLLPLQKSDFKAIYEVMGDCYYTSLDPPLHAPPTPIRILGVITDMGLTFEELKSTVDGLQEMNLCWVSRLLSGNNYPEIVRCTPAIMKLPSKTGKRIQYTSGNNDSIVGEVKELKFVKDVVKKTAEAVLRNG